jgi:glycosyltransferase involved in cell wall biosynthesis
MQTDTKPNLLVYTPMNVRYGGGFEEWLQKTTELLSTNYNVEIVSGLIGTPLRQSPEEAQKLFAAARSLTYVRFLKVLWVYFITPSSFMRLLRRFQAADYVYFNYAFIGQELLVRILSRMTRKKVLVGFHAPLHFASGHDLLFDNYARRILKAFDSFHVVNPGDKLVLEGYGFKPIHFIPNYIWAKDIQNVVETGSKKFIFVGRFEMQKGIDILVKALKLALKGPDRGELSFAFFGSGSLGPQVDALVRQYPKNIVNHGYISEKSSIYKDAAFIMVTSRQEPFGLVILEAMSMGVTPICSVTAGSQLLIRDGYNGMTIADLSPGGIANAILAASKLSSAERSKLASNAIGEVRKHYTEITFRRKFEGALEALR